MLIARSPTRSRSVLIFTADRIARRSTAIGWCSASSFTQRPSISMCSWLIGVSPARTVLDERLVALDQRPHGGADAVLGQAAHFEQPRLELIQLLLEVRNLSRQPNRPVT